MSTLAPRVSAIIPCYNGEAFVGEAIESCLSQTYPDVEIIVIDDGSTDGSVDCIKAFGDAVKLIQLQHAGACVARNTGLQQASGDYVQFLDADDRLLENKFQIQVDFLGSHPDIGLVSCMGFLFGDGKPVRRKKGEQENPDPQGRDAFIYCLRYGLSTEAPLIRRAPLLKVGGFRIIACGQERDLHIRLGAAGVKMHRLSDALYEHREHDSVQRISRTPRPPGVMLENMLSLTEILLREAIYDLRSEDRREALADNLVSFGSAAYRAGAPKALAHKAFKQAECLSKGSSEQLSNAMSSLMSKILGRMWFEQLRATFKK